MKVLISDRTLIYQILEACFRTLDIKPTVAELGVLNGDNALLIEQILCPSSLYLVDAWSCKAFSDYDNINSHRPWVRKLDEFADYYGGLLSEQATFDVKYNAVVEKFAGKDHVKIIRSNTLDAYTVLSDESIGFNGFNLIYVDASHQYETVFDDLMLYKDLLSNNGFLQLNDCCHSALGVEQNLGVLEAVVKFIKMTDFIPVVITNTNWSDILLVRRSSQLVHFVDNIINSNDISYVELPHQLLGALNVKSGKRQNLSFI